MEIFSEIFKTEKKNEKKLIDRKKNERERERESARSSESLLSYSLSSCESHLLAAQLSSAPLLSLLHSALSLILNLENKIFSKKSLVRKRDEHSTEISLAMVPVSYDSLCGDLRERDER